jgi:hypothetical protein
MKKKHGAEQKVQFYGFKDINDSRAPPSLTCYEEKRYARGKGSHNCAGARVKLPNCSP